MNADIDSFFTTMTIAHGKQSVRNRYRKSIQNPGDGFRCAYCKAYVHTIPALSGVQNRNHCPYCLWSRHLDLAQPGDRSSACKATMQPIGLTAKRVKDKYGFTRSGELMLVHRCSQCGRVSINRIAADDSTDGLMDVLEYSSGLDDCTRHVLNFAGIQLLDPKDAQIVIVQLFGNTYN